MKLLAARADSEVREKIDMVRPKKHFGQHFLRDKNIARKVADALSYRGYEYVVEVGPGTGMLTDFLTEKPVRLILIEKDRESVEFLKKKYAGKDIRIIEGDFLKIDLPALTQGKEFAVIGNFPYNISSQIVFKILENRNYIPEAAGMFQKEVAERLAAGPGSKTYGILSVLTRLYYDVKILFTVPPSVFYPPPKVMSAVVKFTRKKEFPNVDYQEFASFVKKAFNQRRKTLRNSLKNANLPTGKLPADWGSKRPEALSPEDFVRLFRLISGNGGKR